MAERSVKNVIIKQEFRKVAYMKNEHLQHIEEEVSTPIDSKSTGNEFPDSIPVLNYLNDSLKKTKSSRRDFLKTMGFSVSAAALAASCEIPVKKALPYVSKPEEITPGKALYYASAYFDGTSFANILVKTRDGRPIKIDGNKDAELTKGATNSAIQASVISLYDHTRFQHPIVNNEKATWQDAITSLQSQLNSASGRKVLLTGPVISPSLQQAINEFTASFGVDHVVYSASKYDGLLKANEESFGQKAAPTYRFENADVIASFGADFLGSWLGGENFYAIGYGEGRKVSGDNLNMSKHYQVESYMSLTGSNADKRMAVKPSQVKKALFQLHNLIASKAGGASVSGVTAEENALLEELAEDLLAHRGSSLVVCGLNDVEAQKATNSINSMLSNYGSTIDFSRTLNFIQGDQEEFAQVTNDIMNNRVGAVLVHGANPVYDSPMGAELKEALDRVKVLASFDVAPNETNNLATHILPDSHYLESWADYEPVTGSFAMAQPTINPIFKTQEFGKTLADLSGYSFEEGKDSYYDYMQAKWQESGNLEGDFQTAWDDLVRAGGKHNPSVAAVTTTTANGSASFTATTESDLEVVLFEDKLGNGTHAANPYLQELPDPVSRVCWGNYAAISPAMARENGWHKFNRNVFPGNEKVPVLKVTANGKSVELPLLIQPGTPNGVIAIPVGYGREIAGLVGKEIGANAHQLAAVENNVVTDFAPATMELTGRKEELAQPQIHYTIPESRITVKETTFADYQENTKAGNVDRYLSEFRDATDLTLYPEHKFPGHKWGMSIDLNSCFGCGSCVVACNIENNVPVVGKDEVARQRDMHWLRIDRYFASENSDPKEEGYMDDPSVVFMPMLCQHCDNAPCENVCPVNATNHSSEGLNQMSYNRCIGTRYCANNCPFKVRRFNWFDYWGADAWGDANDLKKNDVNSEMRQDLSRMILNPDVTVRSRGVIEKCSFCVQRIQAEKLNAKIDGKPMDANAIQTACQQACPTNAIVFGDTNNKESEVHQLLNDDRNYFVLEEFHILPSVGYMTKVTNSDKALFDHMASSHFAHSGGHGEDGHGDGHGDDHGDSHGGGDHSEGTDHGNEEHH